MTEPVKDEARCLACGRYMEGVDRSTESGYDWAYECHNPKCKSNTEERDDYPKVMEVSK